MDLKGAELRNFYVISQSINDQSNKNHGVKIPHYQRPYKWDRDNVKKLIEDWRDHKKKTDYFSGSIVTVASNDKAHDLIDGQQRFTTLFLANFLQFLILRELVSVSLNQDKYFPEFKTLYNELIKSTQYLFNDDSLIESLKEIEEDIYEQRQDKNFDYALKLFNEKFCLSSSDIPNKEERVELLYDKLSNNKLFLIYDRSSFNESLSKVLSHTIYSLDDISDPKFFIFEEDQALFNDNEKVYIEAVKQIYESFNKIVSEDETLRVNTSYKKASKLKDKINDFLMEVKLCLIQTGNTEDAYTLFEVLNDRALALDDLDLIKNLFYKNFVIKNPSLSDSKKDKILQSLDQQWIEKIYQAGISDAEKKLITYLAVSFITGSTSITHKATKDYRNELNTYFLKANYSEQEIKRDFNIFESCRLFIKTFNIKFRSQDILAVQAEYSKVTSTSFKLVHILMALKQEGVLSGFVNFLLNFIKLETMDFELNKVKDLLSQLVNNSYADKTIEAQAKTIWQLSILSKDATIPRQLAVELIKNNNLSSGHVQTCSLPVRVSSVSPNDEFSRWIEEWRFGQNLKIRLLFARLLKSSYEDGKLVNKFFSIGLTDDQVDEIQLDHMEAQNPDEEYLDQYFQHDSRDYYINGIGNMMPLPKVSNIKKSNYPLSKSMKYYKEVGVDKHFIMIETHDLLQKYSHNGIPTDQFFIQRKQRLIDLFKQCIDM
ncbi:DUF262 domain-containing protein [Acinetobacter baumannii]|nr:DUF262 domain-containing protein [Acinetobacter baumannii]